MVQSFTHKIHSNLLSQFRDRPNLPDSMSDFSFLSNRAYILMCKSGAGSIEIYTFSEDGQPSVHIASLCLPPIQPDITIASLSIHSGPFHAHCPEGKLFTTSPDSRIHVATIEYQDHTRRDRTRYCLFVKNDTFMSYISSYVPPEGRTIQWAAWGARHTQFLLHPMPFQWLRWVVIPTRFIRSH
jgi:hypothetical protein